MGSSRMMGLFYGKGNTPSMSTQLRYNEYYNTQEKFDDLYDRSKHDGLEGYDLYSKIIERNNILLAYRNIKNNTGSKTAGTDGKTIIDFKMESEEALITMVRNSLSNYKPGNVRRVEIPKSNGKTRPLGIPTMQDRLIQQMFKQILEPICEAKFYNHSYGFRPNRSTKHAIARSQHLINRNKLHFVVDIDIKGFFDNVNHNKLLKQLYNIGIKDKRVLAIINKMLKAPIDGVGIPKKGTPQGGILSPLLSNIVLNDLDIWIANQWENIKTRHNYSSNGKKHKALKGTKLKEMFIVRYADDFKIFTRNHKTAYKIYHAVRNYLKDSLDLEISSEKSKVTNIRKNKSEFLGFTLIAKRKKHKFVAITNVSPRRTMEIIKKLRSLIKGIQKEPTFRTVTHYNNYVIGIKNYYRNATHVNIDFSEIAYRLLRTLYNRLKSVGKYDIPKNPSKIYKLYNINNYRTFEIMGIHLHPLADIRTLNNMNFNQNICNYTRKGRAEHKNLKGSIIIELQVMMQKMHEEHTIEYIDNKLSKYSMQKGNCSVTGSFVYSDDVHCHHIKPKSLGGTDEFKNLVIVHKSVHKLIHATTEETIVRYMNKLKLNGKQLEKLNKYRKSCNLAEIIQ